MTWNEQSRPAIGIAYSGYTPRFLREHPDAIDYVEVPYELLAHDPSVIAVAEQKPVVLHCASLSVAGSVPPSRETLDSIRHWVERTSTPWLGEHLSFITANAPPPGELADEYAPGEPYNLGYTIHPPMNGEAVETVLRSIDLAHKELGAPLLLENPPLYFRPPGSRMTQTELITRIVERSSVGLLLDLTHFLITCRNSGVDPAGEIRKFPLSRVVEVHVSGVDEQEGAHWDNHSTKAPDEVFELLAYVLDQVTPKAITMEYNWSLRFPIEFLLEEIERVHAVMKAPA
jgi:hypothetical protein